MADYVGTIWTIGHSDRPMEEFLAMLHSFGIEEVADVRSYPGSRHAPQYNKENLEKVLPAEHIIYHPIAQLGGRRKVQPDSLNTRWRHPAFRGYADYMETPGFAEGIKLLKADTSVRRVAMMCSEAVWWRCHRSMISDYLKSEGWRVMHIMGLGKEKEHPYTAAAAIVDGKLIYKAMI
jgi:Uncharacterized conserved protein